MSERRKENPNSSPSPPFFSLSLSLLLSLSLSLVVSRRVPAVVPNDLEAADHLTNGKEADALGGKDATGDKLSPADIPGLL